MKSFSGKCSRAPSSNGSAPWTKRSTAGPARRGLDGRVSDLYRDVIRDESSSQPSLSTRVNTLEYYLTDEIKQDALESRVEMLESTVFGVGKTGALDVRVNELERAVYGNTHFELVTVTLPADTVFKISSMRRSAPR